MKNMMQTMTKIVAICIIKDFIHFSFIIYKIIWGTATETDINVLQKLIFTSRRLDETSAYTTHLAGWQR